MKIITANKAVAPLGHYSQAICSQGLIFVATQLGIDIQNPKAQPGTIIQQTNNIMHSVNEILKAAGSDLDHVLKVTIYVSDISYWDEVNLVYSEWFKSHRPARGVIPITQLHHGYDVAFDVIAEVKSDE